MTEQAESNTVEITVPAAEAAPEAQAAEAPGNGAAPPDTAGQLAALQAELATMKEQKEAVEKAAADAKIATMSDSEKLEAERIAWREEVDAERTKLRLDLRAAALDRAGVMAKYNDFAPDVDVRTTDGQKALEAWINEHPETVKHADVVAKPSPTAAIAAKSSALADILTGKRKSSLITKRSLSEMFGSH